MDALYITFLTRFRLDIDWKMDNVRDGVSRGIDKGVGVCCAQIKKCDVTL